MSERFADNLPCSLKPTDHMFRTVIDSVYNKAEQLLSTPIHLHYTDHTITHSERVLEYIDKLLVNSGISLNDGEKLVLTCATLLHDIGMQYVKGVGGNDVNALTPKQKKDLRKKHNIFSADMIETSLDDGNDRYGLRDVYIYVDEIAFVAKHHRKLKISSRDDTSTHGNDIRLGLLAALLSLGDSLDADSRRVKVEKLKELPIAEESECFWFSHYYVKSISIDGLKIKIQYTFPEKYKLEKTLIKKLVEYTKIGIEEELERVYNILFDYGVTIHKYIDIGCRYKKSMKLLSKELFDYIQLDKSTFTPQVKPVIPAASESIKELMPFFSERHNECSVSDVLSGEKNIFCGFLTCGNISIDDTLHLGHCYFISLIDKLLDVGHDVSIFVGKKQVKKSEKDLYPNYEEQYREVKERWGKAFEKKVTVHEDVRSLADGQKAEKKIDTYVGEISSKFEWTRNNGSLDATLDATLGKWRETEDEIDCFALDSIVDILGLTHDTMDEKRITTREVTSLAYMIYYHPEWFSNIWPSSFWAAWGVFTSTNRNSKTVLIESLRNSYVWDSVTCCLKKVIGHDKYNFNKLYFNNVPNLSMTSFMKGSEKDDTMFLKDFDCSKLSSEYLERVLNMFQVSSEIGFSNLIKSYKERFDIK